MADERPPHVSEERLLGLGQFHEESSVAGLDGGKLTVPAVDERLLVLDLAKFEQLRRQRGLPDTVGFGFAVGAGDGGFGLSICRGDGFGGLGLGLGEFVAGALGVLNGLGLRGDGVGDDLRDTRGADEAELLNADTDGLHLLLDESLYAGEKLSLLLTVDLLDTVGRGDLVERVANDVAQDAVGEEIEIA